MGILSALGAVKVELYWDPAGGTELAGSLDRVFQTRLEKGARTGYGKCLNVNERVLNALFQGREGFRFWRSISSPFFWQTLYR